MAPKRKGLGRGLDALIPNKINNTSAGSDEKSQRQPRAKKNVDVSAESASEKKIEEESPIVEPSTDVTVPDAVESEKSEISDKIEVKSDKNTDNVSEKVLSVKISLVEPNREQPRKKFNEEGIDELAASIAQYGVIQPLLVQWKDNYYEIIAGERRWRAAMKAGLKEIPVIVKEYSNKEAVEISLIENIQREDLNPIEEALAYERLVEEFEMTQEARTLLSLPTAEAQKLIADRIVKEKLSVRDTEKLVKKLVSDVKRPVKKRDYEKEAILGNLSEQLKDIFGTKVSISENSRHRGKIEIEYYSDDELNRIFELLQSLR